jgi:type IV secretion system protein VirB10
VNRRQGGNKMVTLLGFIFIIGIGVALIVAANGNKNAPKKKQSGSSKKQGHPRNRCPFFSLQTITEQSN